MDIRSEILRLLVKYQRLDTAQISIFLGEFDIDAELLNLKERGYIKKTRDIWELNI
jgi:hypothetical protein